MFTSVIRKLGYSVSRISRERRANMFRDLLSPTESDLILDLGSLDGSHIAGIIPFRKNVYAADISAVQLNMAEQRYGFKTILLGESGVIPYPDQFFDIVYASTTIEHVSVDKNDLHLYRSWRQFSEASFERQRRFASEIRRVGKRYFVTTPNKYFPVEGHTWLPWCVIYLPRPAFLKLHSFMSGWWPKKDFPDWSLLTYRQMRELFPDADMVVEKFCGFPKHLIAVKP